VNFSPEIDRTSVSSTILRTIRNGWRTSNSLCFCPAYTSSYVSSEFCTFRCLVGDVCQRYGPLPQCRVKTMNIPQVMISHTLDCKIHTLCHTTRLCHVSRCSCRDTYLLVFVTLNSATLHSLFSFDHFCTLKRFFFFVVWIE
jgi:hypothetical protein